MPSFTLARRIDERDRHVVGDDVARRRSRSARPRSPCRATSVFGSAGNVIVAGWPTAILVASASAKPATTSSCREVLDRDERRGRGGARRARRRCCCAALPCPCCRCRSSSTRRTSCCRRVSPTARVDGGDRAADRRAQHGLAHRLGAGGDGDLVLRHLCAGPARPWRGRPRSRRSPARRRPTAAAARRSASAARRRARALAIAVRSVVHDVVAVVKVCARPVAGALRVLRDDAVDVGGRRA